VLPATLDGLSALSEYFDFAVRRDTHAGRDGATASDLEDAAALRRALSQSSFAWLCACAVYPELHWELTLRLGMLLTGVVSEIDLLRLFRLPWFRSGAMPDDLRVALMRQLTPWQEAHVRREILEILERNPAPSETFAADAQRYQIALQQLRLRPRDRSVRKRLKQLVQDTPSDSAVQDLANLALIETATSSRVDFLLPRRFRKLIYVSGLPGFGVRRAVRVAVTVSLTAILLAGLGIVDREAMMPAGGMTADNAGAYLIEPGTRIPVSLINSVSVKHSAVGDRVYLETVFPILVKGRVVIPQGSYVGTSIAQVNRPGRVNGELYLRFDSLTLPNGVTRDLRPRSGGLDGRAAAAGSAGPMGVLLGREPDTVLPKNSIVEIVLDRPMSFDQDELDFSH
jgi:hypothetical protein